MRESVCISISSFFSHSSGTKRKKSIKYYCYYGSAEKSVMFCEIILLKFLFFAVDYIINDYCFEMSYATKISGKYYRNGTKTQKVLNCLEFTVPENYAHSNGYHNVCVAKH